MGDELGYWRIHPGSVTPQSPTFSSRWTRRPRELKWPLGIKLFQGAAPRQTDDPKEADDPFLPQDAYKSLGLR